MKRKKIILVIIALLILILIAMGILSYFKKTGIIEIKTFSEIPGFSFDYPVFKEWTAKVVKEKDNYYAIYLSHNKIDFGIAPQIKIIKKTQLAQIDLTKLNTNPNGVKYIYNEDESKIFFYTSGFTVDIYPFLYESNGYSGKAFVDKVLETFKFSSSLEDGIQPDPITITEPILLTYLSGFSEKYQSAINAVIEKLKEDGENPDDFYAKFEESKNSNEIIFHLWHKDAFKPENRGIRGNPGGKCRDVYYDVIQKKVTQVSFCQ